MPTINPVRRSLVGGLLLLTTLASTGAPPALAEDAGSTTPNPSAAALDAGGFFTCAVLTTGTVKCWGDNTSGQLGVGDTASRGDDAGEMGTGLPAVAFGTARTAVSVTAGGSFACALLDNRSVKCWGDNGSGQLGLGDSSNRGDAAGELGDALLTVGLGTLRTALAVSAGGGHACAILDNHKVKCWGDASNGSLGYGDTTDRGDNTGEMGQNLPFVDLGTGRTALAISAGHNATCAILDDHGVKCWGSGILGYGDNTVRGDGPNEMGDNLPAIDLGTGRSALAISVGQGHACAILDNSQLKCWGANSDGQLGLGDKATRGDAVGEMGDALPAIDLGPGRFARSVSAGRAQTCAVLDDRSLRCWGANTLGRLGLGDTEGRGDEAGEMGATLPAVDLGSGRAAAAVSTSQPSGGAHVCTVLDDGTVKCWGVGDERLGIEATETIGDEPDEMGDALPAVDLGGAIPHLSADVELDSSASSVVVGSTITYSVHVHNTGSIDLTDVAADATLDVCDRALGDVGAGQTASYTCTLVTTGGDVPGVTNRVTVETGEGLTVSSSIVATPVAPRIRRPDAQVRKEQGSLVGNGTYNSTGAGQTRSVEVAAKGTARFTVRAENDGNAPSALHIDGQGSTSRYTVVYRRGGKDISNKVVAGTYTTGTIATGAHRDITVTITARKSAKVGSVITRDITVRSGTTKDTVRARVTRR